MMRRSFFVGASAAFAASSALPARAEQLPHANVALGDDVLLQSPSQLGNRTVGIITNQTGVTSQLESIVDALHRRTSVRIKAVFAPEHGFRGDRPAGASVGTYTDAQTGLPVYSLYGATRRPTAAMLEGIDVLLFDIQDVGARAYTFVSTMAYAMQGAKAYGKEFWVLDRPNPAGGVMVEGPVLEPAFESFIGLYPIAMRHGMTVGELATLFNDRFGIGTKLHVVKMRGWDRSSIWPDTGLQWVQTSPNVPTWQTCFVLLCTGLIDNAGVNNGTGYSKPFFYAGGADIDGYRLARSLNARNLPGVWFRPAAWSPFAGFWKGRELSGVELDVFDERRFAAVRTAVEILTAVRDLFPSALHVKATELDRDWGTDSLRRGLIGGKGASEIVDGWSVAVERFKTMRQTYLLY
ncbi:MAG TPA: DUF1343 domain-containing protein [Candidatus Baltobacteraceae bacterium]|jgi:uncharacterized protein YbbC (DUF1343 family)|nr:DUF1343 domain-containing protein [Candidatus Baltobacteraceae bacterium]